MGGSIQVRGMLLAKVNKAICERLLRESDESTTHSLSLSQHNHGYPPLSLSRENALKISGQLVV